MDYEDSETGSLDQQQQPSIQTMVSSLIKINFSYVTDTGIGRLKVLEFLCTVLAGCILPSVVAVFFTRFAFYTFVIWTCFMYISIDLFVHVTSLSRLLPKAATSAIMIYLLVIGAISLLISCSLVAGVADFYPDSRHVVRTGFSVFFGYVLMVLFIVESVLHHRESKKPQTSAGSDSDIERTRRMDISGPIYKPSNGNPPSYSESSSGGGMAVPIGGYS